MHYRIRGVVMPLMLLALMAGCTVGPLYRRPAVSTPPAYKERPADAAAADATAAATGQWKLAQPRDAALQGNWWEMFQDPELNSLEQRVSVSNQNIAAAFAAFVQSRALVKQARSQYFPTLTAGASATRAHTPTTAVTTTGTSGVPVGASGNYDDFSLPFDASWVPDLWGRVRNTVRSQTAAAQASAAELQFTRLTAQADLAVDYYELRSQDSLQKLLDDTVSAYQQSLQLTRALYETGIDDDVAVAQAEVQLQTTIAQATNAAIARAQYEHAIALLVGAPASSFSVPVEPLTADPPAIPVGLPSQLLERRPDIAQDERLMAQANAQIGVAKAAYFPTLTLSAAAGFESASLSNWLRWPSRFWSVGPSLAETLFDAGLRRATVEQYRAAYDQSVATYRQAVLAAFQQVEDNLAGLRILSQERGQQDAAVAASQRYVQIENERYRLGIDPYLNVVSAQTALLSNQQTAITLRLQQLTDSVQLIEALGGGWDASQLPTARQIAGESPGIGPQPAATAAD
jgi:NodT family efflux transporter outer membrane factor (OMF) lipoprotein